MKSLFSFTLVFFLLVCNSVFASEDIEFDYEKEKEEFENYIEEVVQEVEDLERDMNVFKDFTDEDYERMLPQILELEAQNPELSEEELNELAYELFVQAKAENDTMVKS